MVKYVDRNSGRVEVENIPAARMLNWLYKEKGIVNKGVRRILRRRTMSVAYGSFQNLRFSKRKINNFIKKYNININEYIVPHGGFKNFNEFFVRKLKNGARKIASEPKVLAAPCDGRYLPIVKINSQEKFVIKNCSLTLKDLVGDLVDEFDGGSGFICRLAPTDYHRFHFPDSGIPKETIHIKGKFDSVNPLAFKSAPDVLFKNKRTFTLFQSDNFGEIAFVEVGAMFVGSIIQTFFPNVHVGKGHEKGFFEFGGSTVIILTKPNVIKISDDIIKNAEEGMETLIKMGDSVAELLN